MEILYLILGWLLGLLSPAIVGYIQDGRNVRILNLILLRRIRELQYGLVLVVFLIESRYDDKFDENFFKWAKSKIDEYKGVNSNEDFLKATKRLVKLPNEEIKKAIQYKQSQVSDRGLSLRKHSLFLSEIDKILFGKFDSMLQDYFLEIETRIGFMNELVEESQYYFKLSFQSDISSENYKIANINMINTYKNYAIQARSIIELISKVLGQQKIKKLFI